MLGPLLLELKKGLGKDAPQTVPVDSEREMLLAERKSETQGRSAFQVPAPYLIKKKRLTGAKDSVKIFFFSQP